MQLIEVPEPTTSQEKRDRLAELEAVIDDCLDKTTQLCAAFAEIRRDRLYLETHNNFDSYIRAKFSKGRTYAHKMASAGEVILALIEQGFSELPSSEYVARPLTNLSPEMQRDAWEESLSQSEEPTGAIVSRVVSKLVEAPTAGSRVRVLDLPDPDMRSLIGNEGIIKKVDRSASLATIRLDIDGAEVMLVPGEFEIIERSPVLLERKLSPVQKLEERVAALEAKMELITKDD